MAAYGSKVLPENHPYGQMCRRVVSRLGPATGKEGVDWRVYVIDEPSVPNAFVIPGGQIFVFTGILPIAQNEAGLATILGHEIAHYTLRHIAEKTSLQQFVTIVGASTFWLFGLPIDWFFQIQHIGLELPNSRACETEADYVGLLYMAKVPSPFDWFVGTTTYGRRVMILGRDPRFGNG
jgi:metalloendopeptidase OMA1, mitochondrial